jgi:hypothetical protein
MAEMTDGATTRLRNALSNIRSLADDMAQRSSFHVTFDDFHIMTADEIRDWRDIVREESGDTAYTLPPELVDIYRLTGGFDFRWTCDADAGPIAGAIVLSSLPELYQRDDEADVPMKQSMTGWRRIDTISPDECTVLRLDGGAAALRCTYVRHEHHIPLNISPTDYIISAADHLGVAGWQTSDTTDKEKIVRELAEWQ